MSPFKYLFKKFKNLFLNFCTRPNKNAIWVFGFQKSGTSAIAALFAEMAGKSATIDSIYLWEPYKTEMEKFGMEKHINRYSLDFSRDVIKEPGATFFIPLIESCFKLEKYIFITRNPYDNIRSILNRLNLPGNLDQISLENVNHKWRDKFKNHGQHYIKDLAELWLEANNQKHYMECDRCVLVKYEDFVKDKIVFIEKLIEEFNLMKINDISDVVNKPFQPKGNPTTDLVNFFGLKNIETIDKICGYRMEELGYNKNEIFKL